jgi:1,4-alpha-glucan branching enzyme
VAAFGRDLESSKQVWSASEGYPGDFEYRDFYRDIGFDLDDDYVAPYVQPDGKRIATGIKYYRITGRTDHKEVYDPDRAAAKADIHAGNFLFNRERQIEYLASHMDRKPIVVAPYDAELFGHWWFEGPRWLDLVIRKTAYDSDVVKLAAPSDYLDEYPRNQVSTPSYSSWGYKGYAEVWLNETNDWTYRHLHKASELMSGLAAEHVSSEGLQLRALRQAAREVLLAQSSDWPFIMKTGTTVPYAVRRFKDHIGRFYRLHHQIQNDSIDEGWLSEIEQRDNLFPNVDYRVFDLSTAREPALAVVP